MSDLKASNEQRAEYATSDGHRRTATRSVKLPGKRQHETTAESAHTIARRLQLEKVERRARR